MAEMFRVKVRASGFTSEVSANRCRNAGRTPSGHLSWSSSRCQEAKINVGKGHPDFPEVITGATGVTSEKSERKLS